MLRIRIPHPNPLVTSTTPAPDKDPDPSSSSKNSKKTLISNVLCHLYDFFSLKNDVNVPVFQIRILSIRMFLGLPDPNMDPLFRGTDPRIRIRIRTKMSRIRNTVNNFIHSLFNLIYLLSNINLIYELPTKL